MSLCEGVVAADHVALPLGIADPLTHRTVCAYLVSPR